MNWIGFDPNGFGTWIGLASIQPELEARAVKQNSLKRRLRERVLSDRLVYDLFFGLDPNGFANMLSIAFGPNGFGAWTKLASIPTDLEHKLACIRSQRNQMIGFDPSGFGEWNGLHSGPAALDNELDCIRSQRNQTIGFDPSGFGERNRLHSNPKDLETETNWLRSQRSWSMSWIAVWGRLEIDWLWFQRLCNNKQVCTVLFGKP